jgi:hypothetical protein
MTVRKALIAFIRRTSGYKSGLVRCTVRVAGIQSEEKLSRLMNWVIKSIVPSADAIDEIPL